MSNPKLKLISQDNNELHALAVAKEKQLKLLKSKLEELQDIRLKSSNGKKKYSVTTKKESRRCLSVSVHPLPQCKRVDLADVIKRESDGETLKRKSIKRGSSKDVARRNNQNDALCVKTTFNDISQDNTRNHTKIKLRKRRHSKESSSKIKDLNILDTEQNYRETEGKLSYDHGKSTEYKEKSNGKIEVFTQHNSFSKQESQTLTPRVREGTTDGTTADSEKEAEKNKMKNEISDITRTLRSINDSLIESTSLVENCIEYCKTFSDYCGDSTRENREKSEDTMPVGIEVINNQNDVDTKSIDTSEQHDNYEEINTSYDSIDSFVLIESIKDNCEEIGMLENLNIN